MTGIIYCYTNKINGKKYIGQTINPEQRKRNHKHEALNYKTDYYFHRAIRKHGLENFEYKVLEENIENLSDREEYYIKEYNTLWPNGYNEISFHLGMPDYIRNKISNTKKQQWINLTEEEKEKRLEKLKKANLGKKQSDYQKKRAAEGRQKTYELKTPNGEIIIITNLLKFCRDNNLNQGNMNKTLEGICTNHKGYVVLRKIES